jgi:6-phosphogluconolactonase
MSELTEKHLLFYVGTYTKGESEGIYLFHMNPATGELSAAGVVSGVEEPSFLALHPDLHTLYAVNELEEFNGQPGGAVSAFHIEPEDGSLTFLNQQATHGGAPCYVSVDADGRVVLVANYSGGNVAAFPVQEDGSLAPASAVIQHEGSGPNPQRQQEPHAHSINLTPDNRFAVAADLGIDKILIYQLDTETGSLSPHDPPSASVPPGSGPRHFDFHPSGRFCYVINEIGSSVTVFAYDSQRCAFEELQTISTLPNGWEGRTSCADIHVSPSGRFLYGSNRGHDSIAIFAIDETRGTLTVVGHQPTGGRTPRNFAIDPTGSFLLAANQNTNNIVVFSIDRASGALEPTGIEISVPMPVCIMFFPRSIG